MLLGTFTIFLQGNRLNVRPNWLYENYHPTLVFGDKGHENECLTLDNWSHSNWI